MSERCDHCGQTIRRSRKSRWQPDPLVDASIAEAAEELGVTRERAYQLVEERWLTVSGRKFGPKAKTSSPGVMYVTRESIAEAAQRRPNILNLEDKRNILRVLDDVGIIGPLQWSSTQYRHRYDRMPAECV